MKRQVCSCTSSRVYIFWSSFFYWQASAMFNASWLQTKKSYRLCQKYQVLMPLRWFRCRIVVRAARKAQYPWEKIEGRNSTGLNIISPRLKAQSSPFFHYFLREKSVKTGEISNHAHLFPRVQCMLYEVVRAFWGALRTFCIRHPDNR
jgi:hypothetical protein